MIQPGLRFDELRTLKIELTIWMEEARWTEEACWRGSLLSLLRRTRQLESLNLKCCTEWETFSGDLWDAINLPILKALRLDKLSYYGTAFCRFLKRHEHLKQLVFVDVDVTHESRAMLISTTDWHDLFDTLRSHPTLEMFEASAHCSHGSHQHLAISRDHTIMCPGHEEGERDLTAFLKSTGEWTECLQDMWKTRYVHAWDQGLFYQQLDGVFYDPRV